ncbi:hypothetical protein NA56DRAFT_697103 [Hyaloscypha hepaticicola]|uniref:Uncharacterized protein n=1 Tax=Hyaloscypha hepaticicola TaxID=2082293 RepID=A0A2J6QP77_9HELO|nr:hypothetical protein NA56DRAFT_697103 [Hyaloscypha hepaticicola]
MASLAVSRVSIVGNSSLAIVYMFPDDIYRTVNHSHHHRRFLEDETNFFISIEYPATRVMIVFTVEPTLSPTVPSIFYGLVFSVLRGISAAWQTSTNFCPLLGLAYPVPPGLSLNKQFQVATEMFDAALETDGLVLRKTALSISVVHGFGII